MTRAQSQGSGSIEDRAPRSPFPGDRRGFSTSRRSPDLSTESSTALVTGAGSGIGRATAIGLAKLGLRVALVGRDGTKLDATKLLVGRDDTLVEPCDVGDRAGVDAMAGRVLASFG